MAEGAIRWDGTRSPMLFQARSRSGTGQVLPCCGWQSVLYLYRHMIEREWAYGRLLNVVQAQLRVEDGAARESVLERWAKVFEEHASK